MSRERPITMVISALGGQGGGVLTNWLVALAEKNHYFAQATSVPGVAQRTGATIYYLELFPGNNGDTPPPVMALMPMAGDVDMVVAAEVMEAGRAVQRQFITPDKTTLITSTHRIFAIDEKMALGNGIHGSAPVITAINEAAKEFIAFDMAQLAADTGCVISAILLGAIAGSGRLPFSKDQFQDAIRAEGKMVEQNLSGFEAGYKAAQNPYKPEIIAPPSDPSITGAANTPAGRELIKRINTLPEEAREFAYAGAKKLLDYQDIDYATQYLGHLEFFTQKDKAPFDLTRELARYLALWMAFDDVIKVADTKTRAARVKNYRREVRATDGQIVHMMEYMHPRLEEITGTMPVNMAKLVGKSSLLTWFFKKFTGPRLSDTTKISSFLMLYFMASLRVIRRRTLRYAREHEEIKSWLENIQKTLDTDYDLAVEIVRCQRLIKGYGETHARGLRNFKTIMETLDREIVTAGGIKELRKAALADEDGVALKQALSA